MNRGRIVEQGTHEKLLANNGLYKQLHDLQFRDYPSAAVADSLGDSC